jgi:hypothetical protein
MSREFDAKGIAFQSPQMAVFRGPGHTALIVAPV